ncbi:UNKNOWN [Stylonychia lemnae]|uniref:Uncharacterized protein n=1 Tax=Stylonychia lemnae TaxID=5949 RepID=A0A078B0T3_STYLE|nr:UNKNOWN [Stylonychia lemnae]|eukprot:CDW86967.1 UNKNOWN [Stylonychia lemnae]
MYRDCLKVSRMMSADKNIAKHFRLEFEKQRSVTDQEKHQDFRKFYHYFRQYLENPNKFKPVNVFNEKDQRDEEEQLKQQEQQEQNAASADYKPPFI